MLQYQFWGSFKNILNDFPGDFLFINSKQVLHLLGPRIPQCFRLRDQSDFELL